MNGLPPINRPMVDQVKPIANVYAMPLPDWIVNKEHLQGLPLEVADFFEGDEVRSMLYGAPCLYSYTLGAGGNWCGIKLDVASIVFYLEVGQDTQPMIDYVNKFSKGLYGTQGGDRYSKVVKINYARERKTKGRSVKKTMVSYELEDGTIQEVETRYEGDGNFSYGTK